jgi:hypothetical protein
MCCIAPTAARGTCSEMCSRASLTPPAKVDAGSNNEDAGKSSSRDGG